MPTHTLSDGTKLRTQSTRRFVVFTIADDSASKPSYSGDSPRAATDEYERLARYGYCRVALVDFKSGHATVETQGQYPASVLRDSAADLPSI